MGALNRLTAKFVATVKDPGRYADGGDLYLNVRRGGSRQWVMLWAKIVRTADGTPRRKQTELSLGPAGPTGLSLADARTKAHDIRQQRLAGLDPKAERLKRASIPTFGEAADAYLATHAHTFKSAKHAAQWRSTLSDAYCARLRAMQVDKITTEDILATLRPIWAKTTETADRLRGRIERVLDAAIVARQHPGPNPAAWKGRLDALLPRRPKLSRGHHAALPYADLPAFMADLRARESLASTALEFAILTAARSNEVLGARWEEIDLDAALWIIPAERMKAGITHRVPLSPRVVELLAALPRAGEFVFPGQSLRRPLSGMAMTMQLRRMGRADITVHGFRSTFRDWAAEKTSYPAHTAEHALAHRISDKAEAAYRRGTEIERRREMMAAWAQWCDPAPANNVIALAR